MSDSWTPERKGRGGWRPPSVGDLQNRTRERLWATWQDKVGLEAPGSINPNMPVPGADPTRPPRLGPNATTGQVLDWLAEWAPQYLGFFNTNMEIRDVLLQAAREGWTENLLTARVQSTQWYRSTTDAARRFQETELNDPATAKAMIQSIAVDLQNRARTFGLGLSPRQLAQLATQVARNGWTEAQTVDALLSNLNWSTVQPGALTATVDDIRDVAGEYLVGISEHTARQYAARVQSGEMTLAGVESALRAQARARFDWMASEIDQGVTPAMMLAPVRDTIASELEVAPDAINLMDPKWLGLIEVRDPDSGRRRAATMEEARLAARQEPQFANTRRGTEMAAGAPSLILQAMGL